jgi:hypothetical protein
VNFKTSIEALAELRRLQARLDAQFRAISAARQESGHPTFAFEHGLTAEEVAIARSALQCVLKDSGLSNEIWLVWVVHATEVGYDFEGDEYWYSFGKHVSRWYIWEDRSRIRNWFQKFQKEFGGVRPKGAWAQHFSIIAWPITHAVLPKDLQGQLARALHHARYELNQIARMGPSEVGELIARTPYDPSSRFRLFLSQEELVGQVVLALLSYRDAGRSYLEPSALNRIVRDLKAVRLHRDWLYDAVEQYEQSKVSFSAPVRGAPSVSADSSQTRALSRPLLTRPTFIAQRATSESWRVVMSLPDFQPLANSNLEYDSFLRKVRVQLPACGDTWFPTGWLLAGLRQRVLKKWPKPSDPLLVFELSDPHFESILASDLRLPPGPGWAFKLDASGAQGNLIVGKVLTAGRQYLVLHSQLSLLGNDYSPCKVDGIDLPGGVVSLPTSVPQSLSEILRQLGFVVTQSISIRPVGVQPRLWDDEGTGEWLTTDSPCFELKKDHIFDGYEIALNGEPAIAMNVEPDAVRTFIKVGPLPAGRHSLRIHTEKRSPDGAYSMTLATCTLSLVIRPPQVWAPGSRVPTGLSVRVTPRDPSLEDLVAKDLGLEIDGPASRYVQVSLAIESTADEPPASLQILQRALPISRDVWQMCLMRFWENGRDDAPFLTANRAHLLVIAEDLGEFKIPLMLRYGPVRWVTRRRQAELMLRLINDGDKAGLRVELFRFEQPLLANALNADDFDAECLIQPSGGLYLASQGEERQGIVIARPIMSGFQQLRCPLEPSALRNFSDKAELLRMLKHWRAARVLDPLGNDWRKRVVRNLEDRFVALLCGSDWGRFQANIREAPQSAEPWLRLEKSVHAQPGFAISLSKAYRDGANSGPEHHCKRFEELCGKFLGIRDQEVIQDAWSLATSPVTWAEMPAAEMDSRIARLTRNSSVLKGARLVALRMEYGTP